MKNVKLGNFSTTIEITITKYEYISFKIFICPTLLIYVHYAELILKYLASFGA